MLWRTRVYSVLALSIVLVIALVATVDEIGDLDPLAWSTIAINGWIGAVLLFVGLDALLGTEGLLRWARSWRPLPQYEFSRWTIRLAGAIAVLAGCLAVYSGVAYALEALGLQRSPARPLEELIAVIEAPESPEFFAAASELAAMGPAAAPAAPALARALAYPRRDSYMAARALVAIGPAGSEALPQLVQALTNERARARSDAAFVLGIIGEPARCAVPQIAQLLWDADPLARTAAAGAIEAIVGVDLVRGSVELDPARPCLVFADEPEGTNSGVARAWWTEEGQYLEWGECPAP
jgi:hypothetical protein